MWTVMEVMMVKLIGRDGVEMVLVGWVGSGGGDGETW